MIKVKPATKEQLVYYLMQNLSLGTYDRRFLNNLQDSQITNKTPATSNQCALLDKITLRYAKQLRRHEIDANDMVNLPWVTAPVESLPEYTDAFCSIKDDIIEVRSPFKKEFISAIKDSDIPVTWDRETKVWTTKFCENSLKHVIDCLDKHYHIVRYDKAVMKIIDTFAEYESATCWNPTYMKVNGNFLIAGINGILNEVLADITLDVEPSTLARLNSAGVEISEEVLHEACAELWNTDEAMKLIDFATTPNTIINTSDIKDLVRHLVDIKCDYVLILEAFKSSNTPHIKELITLLESSNIPFNSITRNSEVERINSTLYKFPVIINTALWGFGQTVSHLGGCKTVFLGNNKPINIK